MVKLTEPTYFLPLIEALEASRILQTGRTKPMIVRGVCTQTGKKGEYVIKLKGSDQMWQGSSLNEILGSFIAAELDFKVPEPVVINVSEEFVETMKQGHDNFGIASRSIGYNFGSEYSISYQELIPGQSISEDLELQLYELFALDIFIGNPDRRVDKPNFLTNGKDLLIFDHELAFSFTQVFSFVRNPTPWIIPKEDMVWISNNFCFNLLRGKDFDFSNFTNRLSVIDETFWKKAKETIPEEWQNEHFNTIKGYLNSIIDNKDEFASELNKLLL